MGLGIGEDDRSFEGCAWFLQEAWLGYMRGNRGVLYIRLDWIEILRAAP